MKRAFLYSLLGILAAMLLPRLLHSSSSQLPSPTTAPQNTTTITVKTHCGVESAELEEYLIGVVAGEMPALFELEALKAQAVAARTYILYRVQHPTPAHPEANICNDATCCKAYCSEDVLRSKWGTDYDTYAQKLRDAVEATRGLCLTYEGDLIEAVFHSSSPGATEASSILWNDRPYLTSVESPETSADVPNFVTAVAFTPARLQALLSEHCGEIRFTDTPAHWLSAFQYTDSGRVQSADCCGTKLSGTQLRSALGLRSCAFTAEYKDDQFLFTVTGYGHGVGLSQYGANVYAKEGRSYNEILAHYYPGTQLTSAAG